VKEGRKEGRRHLEPDPYRAPRRTDPGADAHGKASPVNWLRRAVTMVKAGALLCLAATVSGLALAHFFYAGLGLARILAVVLAITSLVAEVVVLILGALSFAKVFKGARAVCCS